MYLIYTIIMELYKLQYIVEVEGLSRRLFRNFLFGSRLQAVRKNDDPSGYKPPTALQVGEVAFQAKNNRALPLCISLSFHLLFTLCRLGACRV